MGTACVIVFLYQVFRMVRHGGRNEGNIYPGPSVTRFHNSKIRFQYFK